MRTDNPSLVCPVCRRPARGGRTFPLVAADAGLVCSNDACRRGYPCVDGIPVVHPRAAELVTLPGASLAPMTPLEEGNLAGHDASFHDALDHLSTYLDASWGDRAAPPVAGLPRAGGDAIWGRLAARAADPVRSAIDLGTSAGRGVFELARGATSAVGIDTRLMVLRRARRILAGERVDYARRRVGCFYEAATVTGERSHATLVCADALDPPFMPSTFERVVALNLFDAVAKPAQLLLVLDGLCAPGGEIIVSSPFAWSGEVTAPEAQLGGADPPAWLRRTFVDGVGLTARYTVEDEAELEWWLRHSARAATLYGVYYLRVRKGS